MINYIIYGNTSYLDVLNIQTDYMQGRGDLTLFLDSNNLELDELYDKYNNVIFYNNNDQYAKRLLTCFNEVEAEYFLFIHDIDILLEVDSKMIEKFYKFLKLKNYDRIDLKYTNKIDNTTLIKVNKDKHINNWGITPNYNIDNGIYLVKQNDPSNYIYNVNPSIWKKESFIKILNNFNNKSYRTIEEMDVQNFSTQFNIFKLYSKNKIKCGYFECLSIFKFLHISHSGKLLSLNNEFKTEYGQPYNEISDEYLKIIDKYNLRNSDKWNK
jgi:hypothetical protein